MAYTAIETKFLGPTNYRWARIKATARDGWPSTERHESVTQSWSDDDESMKDQHERVAWALVDKMGLSGVEALVCGATDRGYVFVAMNRYGPLGLRR